MVTRWHACAAMITATTLVACDSDSVDRMPGGGGDGGTGASATGGTGGTGGSTDAGTDSGDPILPADWCQNGDTVLAQAAQSIGAGQWAELPDNASLAGLDLHYHLTAWADTGVWNPVRRAVQWVGSPGSCCADPAAYKMLSYDVASDTWQVLDTPWGNDPGHAYDGNALDPATGLHYFARGGADIRAWDGSSWGDPLPEAPFYASVAVGLTWFGDALGGAGGLLHVGSTDDVGVFDGQSWTAPDLQIAGWGGYHMFAEYNPVHHVVWLGAGNDGERQHARLTAELAAQQLQEAPISLNATGAAQKTYDPRSGTFIVLSEEQEDVVTWWTYDIVTDSWTDITAAMQAALPSSWGTTGLRFMVPLDDCGAILLFRHVDAERRVYLYRHTD